jgi:hypothetical protein
MTTNNQFLEAIYQKLQQLTQYKLAKVELTKYVVPAYSLETPEHCIQVKWCTPLDQYAQSIDLGYTIYTDILQLDITTINHTRYSNLINTYDWTDPQLLEKLEALLDTIPNAQRSLEWIK